MTMTNRSDWQLGMSICFYGRADAEAFAHLAEAGVQVVELSHTRQDYIDRLDFVRQPERLRRCAEEQGVRIRSIHLPFSRVEDISMAHPALRNAAMDTNRMLLRAAAEAQIPVAVIHPSSEPISPEERPERFSRCVESLAELTELARSLGMHLAVENLPRTCLGRSVEEMFTICGAVRDLDVVFDTNHLLGEYADLPRFVRTLGSRIVTLHVSDYDFVDERHNLPGEGLVDWESVIEALEDVGYSGPWMYEVKACEGRTAADVAANYRRYILETARN